MSVVEVFHPGTRLYPEHYRELTNDSGIAPEVVTERGYRTIMSAQELRDLGFSEAQARAPGLLLPDHGLDGSQPAHDYKPQNPRMDAKGKPIKYERPPGARNSIDCPPRCRELVRDPSRRLVFTEGKKKADALASRGECCLDLSGVYNFKGRNHYGGSEPIADLEHIPLKCPDEPREVFIGFDSDTSRNRGVREARRRFAALLRSRGAHVLYLELPDLPDGSKCGLDDYLLSHSIDELFALAVEPDDLDGGKRSQADELTALASACELWHTPDGEAFADVFAAGHRETHALRSRAFKSWLSHAYFRRSWKAPNAQAVDDALRSLEGRARFDSPEMLAYVRIARGPDGAIYLDLGDAQWRVVRITPEGWQTVHAVAAPVRFRRPVGMKPLPLPERGGSLAELWRYLNVRASDRPLVLAWLLMALNPSGPYPLLGLYSEQGSGKSTTCRALRELVDPNRADLRAEPREERDLVIAASNGHVLALDNMSRLQPWLSDALCRLATGGGFATRTLYSNDEETIFDAQRPIIINGIEELATRGDLLDRTILLHLPSIPEGERRTEAELWREFEDARPRLLGALLDAVSEAMGELPNVRLEARPRMADFAEWAVAGERALGLVPGEFLRAYTGNRSDANDLALDASAVVPLLRAFMERRDTWNGTAGELRKVLEAMADDTTKRSKDFPSTPRALSGQLRRLAPNLRRAGIEIDFDQRAGHTRRRIIAIAKAGPQPSASSAPSADQSSTGYSALVEGVDADSMRTVMPSADGGMPDNRPRNGPRVVRERGTADGADGADGAPPEPMDGDVMSAIKAVEYRMQEARAEGRSVEAEQLTDQYLRLVASNQHLFAGRTC